MSLRKATISMRFGKKGKGLLGKKPVPKPKPIEKPGNLKKTAKSDEITFRKGPPQVRFKLPLSLV